MIHTNCQSGTNKHSEINDLVDSKKPHVLALTEFGASGMVNDSELGIEGYSLYRGNHSKRNGGPGRGAALYISNTLNHSACPLFDEVAFDCSAWSIVRLTSNKTLLVGVVYRSPSSPALNNQNLLTILGIAKKANCSQLFVCGDFHLPLIDWNTWTSPEGELSFAARFLSVVEDWDWYQHVETSTHKTI